MSPILAALLPVAAAMAMARRARRARVVARVAALLAEEGLQRSELIESGGGTSLLGTWGGAPVSALIESSFFAFDAVSITLTVHDACPGLSARFVGKGYEPRMADEVETGDLQFDERFAVRARTFDALVRLSPPVRDAIRQLLSWGWTLDDGALTLKMSWSGLGMLRHEVWQPAVLKLRSALDSSPSELHRRLAMAEPALEVRYQLVRALVAFGPAFVRRTLPPEAARDENLPLAALAAALLGDGAAWDAAPRWCQVQVVTDAPVAVAALHQARRDEAALLALLNHSEISVVLPAITALGVIGGRGAIEPLLLLLSGRVFTGPAQEAARAAITTIQGRLGGAERGQIAIIEAPAEAGAVEVVGTAGAVSLDGTRN